MCTHREQMPQVDAEHLPELVKFLRTRGVVVLKGPVPVKDCKRIQCKRECTDHPVAHDVAKIPILLSGSLDVMDGNHRLIQRERDGDKTVDAWLIFDHTPKVLQHLWEFPKTYRADDRNNRIEVANAQATPIQS